MVRTDRAWQRPHQACADRSYAVARASQDDTKIKDFYERKKGPLGENKVMVATARKMLEAVYFMLYRKETYHAH